MFQIVPRHVLGGPGQTPPSEKVNIAGIGIGGMGHANLRACAKENIVALCDVDHNYAAKTFEAFPKAKAYKASCEVLIVDKASNSLLRRREFFGGEPPKSKSRSGAEGFGDPPNRDVLGFIEANLKDAEELAAAKGRAGE